MASNLVNIQYTGAAISMPITHVDAAPAQAAGRLAFGAAQPAHRQHEAQRAAEDEADAS